MPAAAAALLVVDQSVELGFLGASWPRLTQRIVVSIASPICMGALLACVLDDAASFRVAARVLGRRACAPVLAVALAILLGWWRSPLGILEAVMALLVAACCIRPDHGLAPILGARPLRFVGTISYALYLVHVAAITSAKHLLPSHASDAPIIFVAGLGIGLPMAWVLHEALDVPLEPLRARLRGAARTPSRPERGSRPSRETTRSSPTPRSP
jgi:peptidoglycan/LPS O-acetylase OafA/YrhL